jgi:hypothetical protein
MKVQIKLFTLVIALGASMFNAAAQVNFDFKSIDDLTNWKGIQADLSIVDNEYMKMVVTGDFWATATYAPEGGLTWNFDKNTVVVVKEQNKHGDLFVKFYDQPTNVDYKMNDPQPLTVANSTSLIHVVAFENYADEYPDLQTGTKTLTNIQIAHEYVSVNMEILVDWIKVFPTLEAAYEFIAPILEGESSTSSEIENFNDITVEVGSAPITLTATAKGNRPVTYTIEQGKESVATLSDGVLTIVGEGTVQVTATAEGNNDYQESVKTITVTVLDYSWLQEVAITVEGNTARVVGPAGSVAKFTKFHVGSTVTDGNSADISAATDGTELKATTADGDVVKLKYKK